MYILCGQENSNVGANVPVGDEACRFSHWSNGPEGWHFPVINENQCLIRFLACNQEKFAIFSRFSHGNDWTKWWKIQNSSKLTNFVTKMFLLFQLRQWLFALDVFVLIQRSYKRLKIWIAVSQPNAANVSCPIYINSYPTWAPVWDQFCHWQESHYENTPIQIYRKFHLQKLKIFR